MKPISASSIQGLHRTWTRPNDGHVFILCTIGDDGRRNVWVSRQSIVDTDDALARRLKTTETFQAWEKKKHGGRSRNTPDSHEECFFVERHADDEGVRPASTRPTASSHAPVDLALIDRIRTLEASVLAMQQWIGQFGMYVHATSPADVPTTSTSPCPMHGAHDEPIDSIARHADPPPEAYDIDSMLDAAQAHPSWLRRFPSAFLTLEEETIDRLDYSHA